MSWELSMQETIEEQQEQIADLKRQLAEAQKALKWIRAKHGALAAGLLAKQALGWKLTDNEETMLREAFDRVGGLED